MYSFMLFRSTSAHFKIKLAFLPAFHLNPALSHLKQPFSLPTCRQAGIWASQDYCGVGVIGCLFWQPLLLSSSSVLKHNLNLKKKGKKIKLDIPSFCTHISTPAAAV